MDKTIILKVISFLFFYSPLIISIILILIGAISFIRKEEPDLNKLKAGVIGSVSVIITSLVMMMLPKSSIIDKVGLWIIKFLYVILILFAIGDTYEGKTNGIKALVCSIAFLFIITLFQRILM